MSPPERKIVVSCNGCTVEKCTRRRGSSYEHRPAVVSHRAAALTCRETHEPASVFSSECAPSLASACDDADSQRTQDLAERRSQRLMLVLEQMRLHWCDWFSSLPSLTRTREPGHRRAGPRHAVLLVSFQPDPSGG
jgi:hypothetical protein